ncbi:MAG: diguanylate cyclase [Planctomycetota bacterium]|jgi:diguanylate cyclase (GGDEF)-like protein/putative nucleotidyltransferase with HDIG domain
MGGVRILLAEDDPDHRELLRVALTEERPFVELTIVDSGPAFLAEAQKSAFDCVILDFNLADDQASDLLRKASGLLKRCPAVVISACPDQSVVVSSLRCGVVDFVPKFEALRGDALWRRVSLALEEAQKRLCKRQRHLQRARRLAEIDALTRLYNRRFFERLLCEQRRRHDRRSHTCCLLLDIDRFKQINDTAGHLVGDQVLVQVADIIRDAAGSCSAAIRWGGEEILVICPGCTPAEGWIWAEKVRRRIESEVTTAPGLDPVTVSIGLTSVAEDRLSMADVERADGAAYLAKQMGRNQVRTSAEVHLHGVLEDIAISEPPDPMVRRQAFLDRVEHDLGPTQWHHVTTHCEQVAVTAARLGEALRFDDELIERLGQGGLLHDLGKCAIPEELLARPGCLSIREQELMARHAECGAEFAEILGTDSLTTSWIRHHHVRFDSVRWTRPSLAASMGARVLCVADAVVTMQTPRAYSRPLSWSEVVCELVRESGRQFDPAVVSAVLRSGVARLEAAA